MDKIFNKQVFYPRLLVGHNHQTNKIVEKKVCFMNFDVQIYFQDGVGLAMLTYICL